MSDLHKLLQKVSNCDLCADTLPLGPNPIVRAEASARIVVIGQAPGTRVHKSSLPWDDPSGARLREWLNVAPEVFYDASRIAIMPMGFCYPGSNPQGRRQPATSGVCTAMARANPLAIAQTGIDLACRRFRPGLLSGQVPAQDHDRHRSGLAGLWPPIHTDTTPELAFRFLALEKPLVRV